jgi:hypothetical protein
LRAAPCSIAASFPRRRAAADHPMEQLESRARGKPRETVEQVAEEPEFVKELRALTPEERRQLLRSWTADAASRGGPDASVTTKPAVARGPVGLD